MQPPTAVRAELPPDLSTVPQARRFVADALRSWRLDELIDDAVLLTSELVTNAVVHAGTRIELTCSLLPHAVHVAVSDHHPTRPLQTPVDPDALEDVERVSGMGLLVPPALASAWGVTYERTAKTVWFRLDLPSAVRAHGTVAADPVYARQELPAASRPLTVATILTTVDGRVLEWSEDAARLLGWHGTAELRLDDLAVEQPGSVSVRDLAALSRWQGELTLRHRQGHAVPVFATLTRTVAQSGAHLLAWVLVHRTDRALIEPPASPPRHRDISASPTGAAIVSEALAARLTLDELLRRTVELARDAFGADAAYVLLGDPAKDRLEIRAAAEPGIAARHFANGSTVTLRGALHLPTVHDDLAELPEVIPFARGMRSMVTVPLLVEGRVTGLLAVAAQRAGQFTNDDAARLQETADRIALSLERARLIELERIRRGWLSFLAEASDLLAGTLDQDMTLALAAQLVVPRLATWCAVYTASDDLVQLSHLWHADETQVDLLRAALEKAPSPDLHGPSGLHPWPGLQEALSGNADLPAALTRGVAFRLPLVARGRTLGLLVLGRAAGERFPHEVIDLAEDLGRRTALALDNARLFAEHATTSRTLQRSLLPHHIPQPPGVEVRLVYEPAGEGHEVGGDFFDVFTAGSDRWCLAVGDVCGTGPEAAAVTGLARHVLRALAADGHSVPTVLERLNAAILDEGERARFLTVVYGEMTRRENGGIRLVLASAGHPPPLRLRPSGEVTSLTEPGPLLGVFSDARFTTETVDLDPGDTLVCVTDGVTERRAGDRLLDDDDGLARTLATCAGHDASAVAARLHRAVLEFASDPIRDDMAILVLRPTPRE